MAFVSVKILAASQLRSVNPQVSFRTGFECAVPVGKEAITAHLVTEESPDRPQAFSSFFSNRSFGAAGTSACPQSAAENGPSHTNVHADSEFNAKALETDIVTAVAFARPPPSTNRFPHSLRVCFAHYEEDVLVEGIRRLSVAVARARAQ